jgi:regulator of sigma E protease
MIITILVFLFVLSILIMAHELGHFLMARKVGIRVEEFGVGYPPRIWSKKRGETIYSINLLPIGGFVRLLGEEGPAEDEEKRQSAFAKASADKGTFWAKSKKARMAVIVAGVLANFFLAVAVFAIVYSVIGIPTKSDQITVVGVAPGSPAEQAGFKEEDVIFKVEDQELKEINRFVEIVDQNKGKRISVQVKRQQDNPCQKQVLGGGPVSLEEQAGKPTFTCRDGELVFLLTPREKPPEGEGALGVVISNVKMIHYPFWQMPFRGVVEGFKEAFGWVTIVIGSLGSIFYRLVTSGIVPEGVAGPVGILQLTSGVAQSGPLMVLQFLGMLSVNLAVINILPFPALDGGKLLFIGLEAVTGKRPKASYERWIHAMGMIILLLFLLLVTINDVARIFRTTGFLTNLRSLLPF